MFTFYLPTRIVHGVNSETPTRRVPRSRMSSRTSACTPAATRIREAKNSRRKLFTVVNILGLTLIEDCTFQVIAVVIHDCHNTKYWQQILYFIEQFRDASRVWTSNLAKVKACISPIDRKSITESSLQGPGLTPEQAAGHVQWFPGARYLVSPEYMLAT